MEKIKVSQDTLYEYLLAHDVKLLRLSEMMGIDNDTVTSCFRHRKDKYGNPRLFSAKNIERLNEVLPLLANEMRECLLQFGTSQVYTNSHGHVYDPGLIVPMKELGHYLNITGLTHRVLGWSQNKKSSVLCRPKAINYGNISEQDVVIINQEVLSIAGVLERYEIMNNDSSSSSC